MDDNNSDKTAEKKKELEEEAEEVSEEIEENIHEEEKEINDLKEEVEEKKELISEFNKETEKEIDKDEEKIEDSEDKIKEFEKEKEDIKEIKEEVEEIKLDDDEISIDAGKSKISGISENSDEEFSIDFSKIKKWFKGFGKEKKEKIKTESGSVDSDEELNINFKETISSASGFVKANKWIVPIVLILIAIFFSTFFRMYPANLPITDDWAENSVYNYYKNQIKAEIDKQYPNLPDMNKNSLVENQFKEFLKTDKGMIEQQIKGTSQQFKSRLQYTGTDGEEHTYLLAIDPYYWYSESRNYINYGKFGDSYDDKGERTFSLRNGRESKKITSIKFHPLF